MSIWQGAYWKAQTERAVASAAGAAVSVIGADAIFNAVQADWQAIGSIALGAAVVSVLKGLAANAVTGTGPGLTGAEVTTPTGRRVAVTNTTEGLVYDAGATWPATVNGVPATIRMVEPDDGPQHRAED